MNVQSTLVENYIAINRCVVVPDKKNVRNNNNIIMADDNNLY